MLVAVMFLRDDPFAVSYPCPGPFAMTEDFSGSCSEARSRMWRSGCGGTRRPGRARLSKAEVVSRLVGCRRVSMWRDLP